MEPKNPIIVNGVDVSGCTYSQIGIDRKCYCEQDLYDDDTPVFTCDNNPNCHYKQLARKERECQQAEQKLELIRDICLYEVKELTDSTIHGGRYVEILQIIDGVK